MKNNKLTIKMIRANVKAGEREKSVLNQKKLKIQLTDKEERTYTITAPDGSCFDIVYKNPYYQDFTIIG